MINKVILMGRLTRDPEIRHTGTGRAVCNFTIAVDNGYSQNRQTDFINCVAWNNQADFMEKYFTKGMMIIAYGRISTRTWEGQDGKKNYVTEVVVSEVSFGETKRARNENSGFDGGYSAPQQSQQASSYSAPVQDTAPQTMPLGVEGEEFSSLAEIDDDLPF